MILVWVWVFLLGLAVGSFLNVVVYRVLHGDSPFAGRSRCPQCKRKIAWYDNIPLVSFVWLKGKCRSCGKKISWRYPALELLTGMLFVWWFGVGQLFFRLTSEPYKTLQPVFWLVVGTGLVSLTVADIFYGVLPDLFTMGLAGLALSYRVVLTLAGIMQVSDFWGLVVAGVGASLFLGVLLGVTKGKGMGMGDVKLALAIGWILGWPKIVTALFTAFLTGAIVGLILILKGKKKFGQTIPFGPFLVMGTGVALVWGERMVEWYLGMLGI